MTSAGIANRERTCSTFAEEGEHQRRPQETKVTYSCRCRVGAGGREVPRGDDARSAENQHIDDRARCEVAGVELGIKRLTKWLARDEAQKGWERKAKREGV